MHVTGMASDEGRIRRWGKESIPYFTAPYSYCGYDFPVCVTAITEFSFEVK